MTRIKLFVLSVMSILFVACSGDDNSKSEQLISFNALSPHNRSEVSFELNASASSGLPVSFSSSDLSTASINGKTVTLLKAGNVTITASQAGNDEYYEAPNVSRTLSIQEGNDSSKKSQTITFNLNITELKSSYGDLTLDANASSGLPVTFTVSNPDIALITGNILRLQDGTYSDENITITASQSGNNEYNAAPNVAKSLQVEHDTH
jgi:hypothetical protein